MAIQNSFYATVRRKSPSAGIDYVQPQRVLLFVNPGFKQPLTNTKRGGCVLKAVDSASRGSAKYELYETVSQLNTAIEPTSTNFTPDYASAVVAAGTTQGTATALGAVYLNKITSGTDGTAGVKLNLATAKQVQVVINATAAALKVYPGTGDLIIDKTGTAQAINAGVLVPAGATWHFAWNPVTALTIQIAVDA